MNALETRSLCVSVRRRTVLDNCTMRVRKGAIYALLGDAGVGKTALLAAACGLVAPSSGDVLLFGAAPTPESRARAGSLVGTPALVPSLSAFDNLMVKALATGVVDAHRQCQEVLDRVGFENDHRPARQLSVGQRKRTALALALLGSPDLLLLDEPFEGLDAHDVRGVSSLVRDYVENRGTSVVIASRGLAGIEGLASDYGVIVAGRMACELTAERLAERCGGGLRVRTADLERSLALLHEELPSAQVSVEFDVATSASYLLVAGVEARAVSSALFSAGIEVLELARCSRSIEDVLMEFAKKGPSHA